MTDAFTSDWHSRFRFDHAQDIWVGRAGRVPYDEGTNTWVLPGGIRTADHERAVAVATNIDRNTRSTSA